MESSNILVGVHGGEKGIGRKGEKLEENDDV